jgi:TPR repeat protein
MNRDYQLLNLLRGAAEGGSAPAQFSLGKAYEGGKLGLARLEKNEKTALEMYRKAADGGDQDAQYKLSWAYHMGKFGLDVDQEKAFGFVQEAAKGGSSRAQGTFKRIETIGTYCDRCMRPEFSCAGHGSEFCEEFVRVINIYGV